MPDCLAPEDLVHMRKWAVSSGDGASPATLEQLLDEIEACWRVIEAARPVASGAIDCIYALRKRMDEYDKRGKE